MINLLVFAGVMFVLIRIYIITSPEFSKKESTKPFVYLSRTSPSDKDYSRAQFKFSQLAHRQILSILSTVYKNRNFTSSYISKIEWDKKTQDSVITLGDNTYSAFDAFCYHKEKLSLSYPYTGKKWIQDRRKAQEKMDSRQKKSARK